MAGVSLHRPGTSLKPGSLLQNLKGLNHGSPVGLDKAPFSVHFGRAAAGVWAVGGGVVGGVVGWGWGG